MAALGMMNLDPYLVAKSPLVWETVFSGRDCVVNRTGRSVILHVAGSWQSKYWEIVDRYNVNGLSIRVGNRTSGKESGFLEAPTRWKKLFIHGEKNFPWKAIESLNRLQILRASCAALEPPPINFSGMTQLKEVAVSWNPVWSASIANATQISGLGAWLDVKLKPGEGPRKLDLTKLTQLEKLELSGLNDVEAVGCSDNVRLRSLTVSFCGKLAISLNPILEKCEYLRIDGKAHLNLEELDCARNLKVLWLNKTGSLERARFLDKLKQLEKLVVMGTKPTPEAQERIAAIRERLREKVTAEQALTANG